jgi:hypothetical protein
VVGCEQQRRSREWHTLNFFSNASIRERLSELAPTSGVTVCSAVILLMTRPAEKDRGAN